MVFDEFDRSSDPFDLRHTIAGLETLAVELRQSIEITNQEARVNYYKDQAMALAKLLALDEKIKELIEDQAERLEFCKHMANKFYNQIEIQFSKHYGTHTAITPEQAKVMATIIDSKGKMVERAKKLAEKTFVHVPYDGQLIEFLLQLIAQVVMPNITKMADRIAVAEAAKQFVPSMLKSGTAGQ